MTGSPHTEKILVTNPKSSRLPRPTPAPFGVVSRNAPRPMRPSNARALAAGPRVRVTTTERNSR